jgi:hypothetical protein
MRRHPFARRIVQAGEAASVQTSARLGIGGRLRAIAWCATWSCGSLMPGLVASATLLRSFGGGDA